MRKNRVYKFGESAMKKSNSAIIFLLLFLFFLNPVYGQKEKENKKVKILPVPSIGYSPETKFYLGAVTLFTLDFYNDSLTRTSNAKLEFTYTWNKQLILESEWNYFFKEESWFTNGKIHFSDYPDLYYGLGSETPESNELTFDSKRLIINTSVLKNINKKWFVGPSLKYFNFMDVEASDDSQLYPELVSNSTFGLGLSLLKDSRNNLLTPTKGFFFNLTGMHNFSDENYQELTADIRYYKTWKNKFTLANRFLGDFTTHTPPFFDYAMLGGDKYVRGYYLGRYRDNNLSTIQSEFRFPVYRKFGMAVFGGLSTLYSKNNSFNFEYTKPNYGFGIRYLVDKSGNTYLRMDYAVGQDNNDGFYISFGESF